MLFNQQSRQLRSTSYSTFLIQKGVARGNNGTVMAIVQSVTSLS